MIFRNHRIWHLIRITVCKFGCLILFLGSLFGILYNSLLKFVLTVLVNYFFYIRKVIFQTLLIYKYTFYTLSWELNRVYVFTWEGLSHYRRFLFYLIFNNFPLVESYLVSTFTFSILIFLESPFVLLFKSTVT